MKSFCLPLCLLLCIVGTRPAGASLAVPLHHASAVSSHDRSGSPVKQTMAADVGQEAADEDVPSGDQRSAAATKSGLDGVFSPSPVTQTVAELKAARTMKTVAATGVEGSSGGVRISTTIIPMSGISISTIVIPGSAVTLSQLAAMYRPRSGFFFESPDTPGSEMRLMTITPSAPEIRMLSPYQTDDSREEVPLPPAGLLLATGLAAWLTAGKRRLFRPRPASPAL